MKKGVIIKRSIQLTQIGQSGYRVDSTTNFLEQRTGVTIDRATVERYMKNGIMVKVSRNK